MDEKDIWWFGRLLKGALLAFFYLSQREGTLRKESIFGVLCREPVIISASLVLLSHRAAG
jgi:hypothetical protein